MRNDQDDTASLACHELLLRLAGRLPDEDLWRYRDWLAADAVGVIARTLPKALLRNDIDLSSAEYELLRTALLPSGADPHLVGSTLGVDDAQERTYTFSDAAPAAGNAVDSVSAVVDAALRGRPEVGEVRESWRSGSGKPKRVLLITSIAGWSRLTGELQRVLRVVGDEVPSIEVLPPRVNLPEYHLSALARSRTVSIGAEGAA